MYDESMILQQTHEYLSQASLTQRTKDNYEHFLRSFFNWFKDTYPEGDPKDVDPTTVAAWFATRPAWSSATKYSAACALREFYRYHYGETHPVIRVKVKRIDPGPQRTLDRDELTAILSTVDTTTEKGIRDLAIICLMVDTGMRAGEICRLEYDRVDLRKRKLTVMTKGGRWQEKMFFEYTAHVLDRWLSLREDMAQPWVNTFFVSTGGRRRGTPLTISGLRYLFNRLSALADVTHISPHAMRRTFATLAIEGGAPTRLVQVAGGWQSLRMVERYTQALKPDTMSRYSPINQIMGLDTDKGSDH